MTHDSATGVLFGFPRGAAAIVTGAGNGIGRETARLLSGAGLTVAAWDIDEAGAVGTRELIEREGGRCHVVACDVADPVAVREALSGTIVSVGPVPYLVNNAGPPSSGTGDFLELVRGSIGAVKSVTEAWAEQPPPTGSAVVNVASVAGNLVGTDSDWYGACKAAIVGYTRHLAAYRSSEFRANAVAPGLTNTRRLTSFAESPVGLRTLDRIPMRRMGEATEVAAAIAFLLCPLAGYVNGVLLPVDGGWTVAQ